LEEREAELEEKHHQREARSASDHTDGQSVRITELQLLDISIYCMNSQKIKVVTCAAFSIMHIVGYIYIFPLENIVLEIVLQ